MLFSMMVMMMMIGGIEVNVCVSVIGLALSREAVLNCLLFIQTY